MKLRAAIAVSIPLFVGEALTAANARAEMRLVTAVRHWSLGEVTRVAIEVNGDFQFRTDRLHNPERVYFDILNARPSIESRRLFSEAVNDRLLQRVRVAETVPGITRVVLDLAEAVEATPSQLVNPNRLVIELRSGTPPAIPPPPILSTSLPPAPKPPILKTEPPRVEPPAAPPKPVAVVEPAVTAEPSKAQVSADNVSATTGDAALVAKVEPPKVEVLAPPSPSAAESAKSARHTSTGQSSLIRALGLKINRVVIDPGHGGQDQGTAGPKGLLEKDLVLDVSKRLGKLIEDGMGAEVIYTRSDDTFVPLEGRTALANEKKADLFLSIHANSSSVPRVSGIETYYLNFTDSKDALDVASRENASSEKSVFELRDIIQKITLHDKAEESREFAGRIQTSLFALSARNFPGEKNRGVRKAPFVVLIGANMPSVLAEIGFLSNPKEEALLKKPEYRQKLAESLYRGLSRYAEGLSHFQMALN
jgi:N-acetylmuramoyl-L-alanine amidase